MTTVPAHSGWFSIADCLPESGRCVLAVLRYQEGGQVVIRAMYAPRHTLSEDNYGYGELFDGDYDEDTDTTYWHEGWYECSACEAYWCLVEEVTHWMPVPSLPR